MKILLSEDQVKKLLNELGDTKHVVDRLYQRFNAGSMPVFIRRTIQDPYVDKKYGITHVDFVNVGIYKFSQSEMDEINDKINLLFSYDYRKNGTFAVEIKRFDIANRLDQITFFDEPGKTYYKDMAIQNKRDLCFANFSDSFGGDLDKNSKKWGDGVVLIIRANDATTIFWGDSTKFSPQYFGTEYHIKKVEMFIQKNSTKPAEVPEKIKNFIDQNKKSFSEPEVEPVDEAGQEDVEDETL